MGVVKRMQQVRRNIFLILLLLAAMLIVPMVSADELNKNQGSVANGKNMSINLTSPKEGEVFFLYSDAIPPYLAITVLGVIDTTYGLQNVTISNCDRETVCGFTYGNHSNLQCEVQSEVGCNQIIVTARDKQGNFARIARNYSFELVQHGPLETTNIFIYGKVTDTANHALSGVAVVIEPLSNPPNWEDYVKKSTTGENGTYTIKDGVPFGFDYERNISVKKEGYEPIKKKITIIFGNQTYEQSFILSPQNNNLSGFDSLLGLCAIFIGLLIFTIRKW
ncbi:MAG TPA: hypothetical protein P5013_06840 [Methanoregula sp.]|nr:hypothetical protein [Methanoregula sp.]